MGANNPQTIRLIDHINSSDNGTYYEILGWIDNDRSKVGKEFFGYKVLGTFEILKEDSSKSRNNAFTLSVLRSIVVNILKLHKVSNFNEVIEKPQPGLQPFDIPWAFTFCLHRCQIYFNSSVK